VRQHSLNTLDFQPDTSSVDGQTSAWGASPRTWKTPGGIPVVFRPSPTLARDSTTDPAALRLHLDHARLIQEFPKDSWFEIYDYGVGDEVVWPYSASVTSTNPDNTA
jgi:hypothetical protein